MVLHGFASRNKKPNFSLKACNTYINNGKKGKPALLTRTCPPGLALAGPDMSEVRVLLQFRMFWVQNYVFEVIS